MGKKLFYGYQRVSGNQFVYEVLQFIFEFAGIKSGSIALIFLLLFP